MPAYRYEHVVFLFLGKSVQGVTVTAPGAATTRGAEIGGPLASVQAAYPDLQCDVAYKNDDHNPEFPACTGKTAPQRFIWFGGNPVKNITMAKRPFGF